MELLLVLLGIGAVIITYQLCQPLLMKRLKQKKINQWTSNTHFEVTLKPANDELPYDFSFKRLETTYHVKVFVIPKYAEVIINAKTTWELRYGAGNTPGKAHPIKKYMTGVSKFMNYEVDENTKKIAVLTPDAKKKVKYINENEMVFVEPKTNVYGIQLLNESELVEMLKIES